jgi:Flp pilus assembly protein TadG
MQAPLPPLHKRTALKQRGASAVEFALLLPLLVLMLDGMLEFGLILHNQSVLTSASYLAARAGIAQDSPKLSATQIAAIATNYCTGRLVSWGNGSAPTVTVVQSGLSSYPNPLQVTVHFTFTGLLGFVQANPVLTASTVMYNE